jgi:ABC-type branched-subunit amino acid transport system permease subunit
MAAVSGTLRPHEYFLAQARWRPIEIAFWLATLLPFFLFPNYLSLASQIAITALFALSLDLILGYAGIVSLGHAAFFGLGAYAAGLFSKFVWGEPITSSRAAPTACRVCASGRSSTTFASTFTVTRLTPTRWPSCSWPSSSRAG